MNSLGCGFALILRRGKIAAADQPSRPRLSPGEAQCGILVMLARAVSPPPALLDPMQGKGQPIGLDPVDEDMRIDLDLEPVIVDQLEISGSGALSWSRTMA
jgi:hypothetical protein